MPEHTEVVREFEPRHPASDAVDDGFKLLRGFSRPGAGLFGLPCPFFRYAEACLEPLDHRVEGAGQLAEFILAPDV